MKKFWTWMVLIILPVGLLAQGINNGEIVNQTQSLRVFKQSEGLVGSPYVNENYLPASVSNSETMYSVKYNAFLDQMEIMTEGGSVKALPMMFNYTINFAQDNKSYQVFSKEDGKNGFFVVLYRGDDVVLLMKEIVKFYEEVQPNTGYDKYQPPTLKREKDRYYIGYKNNTSALLPMKKKEFFAKFGNQANEVKSYVKSNKLNIKKPEDLISIFTYYDSL